MAIARHRGMPGFTNKNIKKAHAAAKAAATRKATREAAAAAAAAAREEYEMAGPRASRAAAVKAKATIKKVLSGAPVAVQNRAAAAAGNAAGAAAANAAKAAGNAAAAAAANAAAKHAGKTAENHLREAREARVAYEKKLSNWAISLYRAPFPTGFKNATRRNNRRNAAANNLAGAMGRMGVGK